MKEERVWQFRTFIYFAAIIAFFVSMVVKCSRDKVEEKNQDTRPIGYMNASDIADVFWPPDMIPHPHIPEPAPQDGNAHV